MRYNFFTGFLVKFMYNFFSLFGSPIFFLTFSFVLVDSHDASVEEVTALNRYVRLQFDVDRREAVGVAAKHILNHGRVLHLRSLGLAAKLIHYVKKEVTPENVALIVHNKCV